MTTLEKIVSALKPLNMRELDALAERSGVPFRTIYNIRHGITTRPRLQTAEALMRALGI